MKSRKDQVQAYFFVVGRLAAAVTHGKPDVLHAPSKRMSTGTVLGVVLAAVLMGIFGIVGLFVPSAGSSSWRQEGAIVMNKETGARYVYLGGQLRPVLNYSSARLVAGKSGSGAVASVSPASLAGTPVGQPIGIPGAPDALPAVTKVDGGSWTVCAQSAGTGQPVVTLLLGLPAEQPLNEAQALLVSASDGTDYLVWRGKRLRIPESSVLAALGYGDARPARVAPAWLNAIPQGADLEAPAVPGAGQPGPVIDGQQSRVGQIFQVRNPTINSDQLYVVRQGGLAPLSRTAAALLLAAPATRQAYPDMTVEPIAAGPSALTGVRVSADSGLAGDLPPVPPQVITPSPDQLPCVDNELTPTGQMTSVAETLPAGDVLAASVPLGAHKAGATADRAAIPAGGGALVRQSSAPGATPGTAFLVTEVGTKYPLADADVVSALGYGEGSAVVVPAQLLALLPTGPVLSMDAARKAQDPKP
ncbi:type VII secretion protein EccB [Amycolatopsis pigmentata]|uniref:Type VII secretion protein EccB n=1 Tax=Amycolatopsis pigmentata TaxID=450801 RepID=A0ABW5FX47_9PSEU